MSVGKDELRQMIKEVLAEHDGIKKVLANMPSITETTRNHACECPDCYCDIIRNMNEQSDYFCKDCGLPLGNKEFADKIDKCPNCGHKEMRHVPRWERSSLP